MNAMLEPRIVAARTHRAVAGLQGDGSVAWRMASSQGPLARTLIADPRSLDYSPLIAGRERGTRERFMNHAKSVKTLSSVHTHWPKIELTSYALEASIGILSCLLMLRGSESIGKGTRKKEML
jgi:hypothetical protein